jgi:hypothetical protein
LEFQSRRKNSFAGSLATFLTDPIHFCFLFFSRLEPFLVAHLAVAIGAKTRATYWLDKGSNRLPRVFFISKSSVDSLERFRKPKN